MKNKINKKDSQFLHFTTIVLMNVGIHALNNGEWVAINI